MAKEKIDFCSHCSCPQDAGMDVPKQEPWASSFCAKGTAEPKGHGAVRRDTSHQSRVLRAPPKLALDNICIL